MKRSFVSSRQSAFLIILVLLLTALFITIYYYIIENKKQYLIQRNFRQLNYISSMIQQEASSMYGVVVNLSDTDRTDISFTKYHIIHSRSPVNKSSVDFKLTDGRLALLITKNPFIISDPDIQTIFEDKKQQKLFNDMFLVKTETNNSGGLSEKVFQLPAPVTGFTSLRSVVTTKGDTLRFEYITNHDFYTEINSGGEDYLLFIHPMNINIPGSSSNDSRQNWILCGLTIKSSFASEVHSLSPNAILLFIVIIVLILLSWPLLKLKFVSRYGHIRSVDIILTALAIIFASVAITYTLLDLMVTVNHNGHVNQTLRHISRKMKNNFQSEIKSAFDELSKKIEDTDKWNLKTHYATSQTRQQINNQLQYVHLHLSDLITGEQKFKFPVTKKRTPFINLTQRGYFQKTSHDLLWSNAAGISEGIILEPHRSMTTGEYEITMASKKKFKDKYYVAGMDFVPVSVYSPVLPRGFSYAIINTDGLVLFHSSKDRNLIENFFAECSNSEMIESAIKTGSEEIFSSDYWGKKMEGIITPLDGIPWYIIVMFDKDILRLSNMITVYLATMLFLIYLIPFFIFLITLLLLKRSARNWIWVQTEQAETYKHLFWSFVLYFICLLGISIYYGPDRFQTILAIFIYPHAAFVYGLSAILISQYISQLKYKIFLSVTVMTVDYFILSVILLANNLYSAFWFLLLLSYMLAIILIIFRSQYRTMPVDNTIITSSVMYARMLLVLLLLGSVLPAVGFFSVSYLSQEITYIKQAQIDYVEKLQNRKAEIIELYSNVNKYDQASAPALITRRINQNNDQYVDEFLGMKITKGKPKETPAMSRSQKFPSPEAGLSRFDSVLAHNIIPGIGRIASENRLLKIKPENKNLSWASDFMMNYQNKSFFGDSLEVSGSPLPLFKAFIGHGDSIWIFLLRIIIYIVLLIAVLRLFYNLIYFTLKSAFLIDANNPTENYPVSFLTSGSSNILLLPPGAMLIQSKFKEEKEFIDTKNVIRQIRVKSSPDIKFKWKIKPESLSDKIVLYNFEYGFSNPDINMEKLLMLETLIYTYNLKVVLISNVHPLGGFQCAQPGADVQTRQKAFNRWKNILSGFVVLSQYSFHVAEPQKLNIGVFETN